MWVAGREGYGSHEERVSASLRRAALGLERKSSAGLTIDWSFMQHFRSVLLCLALCTFAIAQPKDAPMTQHARGTFTVDVKPLSPSPADGIARFSIDKDIHGDLEATSKGEMFSAGDPKRRTAGYVAIEVVTGTLAGKHGSFTLLHSATMDGNERKMTVIVAPGSGTGELKGISGTFDIQIADGKHSYELIYMLPQ